MRERNADLFETLKDKLGCEYISDLRYEPYNSAARNYIFTLCLEDHSLHVLTDAARYLFHAEANFANMEQARTFFSAAKRCR